MSRRVEMNPAAKKPGFWLAIVALIFGVYTLVQIIDSGRTVRDPRHPVPSPTATVVPSGPTPSPLCADAASSRCWETRDEQGPPWFWREKARVRSMPVPSCEVTGWTAPCTQSTESDDLTWFAMIDGDLSVIPECRDAAGTGAPCVWPDADDAGNVSLFL